MISTLFQDLRLGVRQLLGQPAFSVVALLTLAVGIGANSALFSAVQAVLLTPLPYPQPDRIVAVDESNLERGWRRFGVSPANFSDWRRQNTVFEALAVYLSRDFNYTSADRAERLEGAVEMVNFYKRLLDRLEALPGVGSATVVNRAPLAGNWWNTTFSTYGRAQARSELPNALGRAVMPGYFQTLGIPILLGRAFDSGDGDGGQPVVVIDEELARSNWPDQNPLGERITLQDPSDQLAVWYTVVGVAGSTSYRSLERGWSPTLYYPLAHSFFGHYGDWGMDVVLRAESSPALLTGAVRNAVYETDPSLPVFDLRSGDQMLRQSWAPRRFQSLLFASLALVALLLCGVGIYGVVSYSVSLRLREMGVRRALGAQAWKLLQQVLGNALGPLLVGLVLGLLGAWGAAWLLAEMLFQVGTFDAVAWALAPGLLALVAVVASILPARRALRVDPLQALRSE